VRRRAEGRVSAAADRSSSAVSVVFEFEMKRAVLPYITVSRAITQWRYAEVNKSVGSSEVGAGRARADVLEMLAHFCSPNIG
jgi:hypothetical protein